jgi:hypothetical protein
VRQPEAVTTHLRVGFDDDGAWRTFGLRKDFYPAVKIQAEDDITASVVVPRRPASRTPAGDGNAGSLGQVRAELRIPPVPTPRRCHPSRLRQADGEGFFRARTISSPTTNRSRSRDAREIIEDAIGFNQYTEPMQRSSARRSGRRKLFRLHGAPRLVDGKPSKNPRYLQIRPDLLAPREVHLAEMAMRLRRRSPGPIARCHNPVTAVLPGRRNNPPEPGIRPLAVFNPIHYFELPELFMEFICSMTGKSPPPPAPDRKVR